MKKLYSFSLLKNNALKESFLINCCKKLLPSLMLMFLTVFPSLGQDVIAFQSFESLGSDTWAYTETANNGTIGLSTEKVLSESNSLKMSGSASGLNSDLWVVFSSIDVSQYNNLNLSIAYAADGPDAQDDLEFWVKEDDGDFVQLTFVDGYNSSKYNFGGTPNSATGSTTDNPYIYSIPSGVQKVEFKVLFDERTSKDNTSDHYFIDDVKLTGISIHSTKPTLSLSVSPELSTTKEADTESFVYTATLSSAMDAPFSATVEITGENITNTDYSLSSSIINIPPGATTGTVELSILNENDKEYDEELTLSLLADDQLVTVIDGSYTITIQDDDMFQHSGTEEDPYTIEEAILLQESSDNYYAVGYIVGVGSDFETPFTNGYYISIADSKDETNFDNCLNLKLEAGDNRDTWNLKDNPGNLGKQIKFNGNRNSYNSHSAFLKNSVIEELSSGSTQPSVELTLSTNSGSETDKTVITLTSTLSEIATDDQTIDISITGEGITADDYTLSATQLTISAGETTTTATLSILDDSDNEGDETLTISLNNPSAGIQLGTTVSGDISLTDNDNIAIPGSETSPLTITEALSLSESSTEYYAYGYIVGVGSDFETPFTNEKYVSVAESKDETNRDNCLSLQFGSDTKADWNLVDHPENLGKQIKFNGYRDSYYSHSSFEGNTVVVEIVSEPETPSVELTLSTNSGSETDQTVITLTATASKAVVENQTIDFSITGTGITAEDYTLSATQLTISAGETTAKATLSILDDSDNEGDETLTISLNNPSAGIQLGTTVSGDISLTDNDNIAVPGSASSPLTITEAISLTESKTEYYAYGYIVGVGDNFEFPFNNGDYVTVADSEDEVDYTKCLNLKLGTDLKPDWNLVNNLNVLHRKIKFNGYRDSYYSHQSFEGNSEIVDLTPENTPFVSLSVSENSGVEEEKTIITVTATSSVALTEAQTFQLSVGGFQVTESDYSLSSQSITLAANSTSGSVTFTLLDDTEKEATEIASIFINSPSDNVLIGSHYSEEIRITNAESNAKDYGTPKNPTFDEVTPTCAYDYYADAENKSGTELRTSLQSVVVNATTKGQNYGDIWSILKEADENPENPNQVWLIYREFGLDKGEQDGQTSSSDKWNREHLWAQSLGGFKDGTSSTADGKDTYFSTTADDLDHAHADAHHLRAAHKNENSTRNNKDFSDVTSTDSYSPPLSARGDIARSLLYMEIRYNELNVIDGFSSTTGSHTIGDLTTLLRWNTEDPVDDFEKHRNNVVYEWQNNRNPFIDYPELVDYIWGDKTDEAWRSSDFIITENLTDFGMVKLGEESSVQTFTISADDLVKDITINAPQHFLLSTDAINYSSTVSLPFNSGSVSETTISVKFVPELAVSEKVSGNIQIKSGDNSISLPISGTILGKIEITGPLADFGMVKYGEESTVQTYNVSAYSLTEDMIITSPLHFLLSTDDVNYTSSVTLPLNSGSVAETTISVKFVPESAVDKEVTGEIKIASGEESKSISVIGTEGDPALVPVALLNEDFQSDTHANWIVKTEVGDRSWALSEYSDSKYMQMSGYSATGDLTSWLITPALDLDAYTNEKLNFKTKNGYYKGTTLEVLISTDFDGSDVTTATWQTLPVTIDERDNAAYGTDFVLSGDVDLSTFEGIAYIAFKYTGNGSTLSTTYQVDDVVVKGIKVPLTGTLASNLTEDLQFPFTELGEFSETKSYELNFDKLEGDISVNASDNYELSLDGTTWTSTLTIANTKTSPQLINVRFAPKTTVISGTKGSITHKAKAAETLILNTSSNPSSEITDASTLGNDKTLDIVSWNLEWFGAPQKSNDASSFPEQLAAVSAKIIDLDADVYAIQELVSDDLNGEFLQPLVDQLNKLAGSEVYTGIMGPRYSHDDGDLSLEYPAQRVCFIYNKSTVNKLNDFSMFSDLYEGSTTTSIEGYTGDASEFWASGRLPYLFEAEVTIDGVSEVLSFVNIHGKCCYDGYSRKLADAKFLMDALKTDYTDNNLVILGDYNDYLEGSMTTGNSSPYSSWFETTDYFDHVLTSSTNIDHITISNELYDEYQVLTNNTNVGNLSISDHQPILLRLKLNSNTSIKKDQEITFTELADKTFGDAAFELVASSSSELAVSFELVSGPATIAENELTITGAGTVVLKAVQAGNENFEAAESVSRTFAVNKAAQTITFAELSDKTFGDTAFELVASSSSELAVSFELISGPATIAENQLSITGAGDVTVKAVQIGNGNYEAAESVSRTFTVNKAAQAITFAELANKTFGDTAFDLSSTSSSTLDVAFELVSGPATIAENELSIIGAGTVVLKAVQTGNENYEAAESVSRTFTVNKTAQAITFVELSDKVYGDAAFELVASSSSELAVRFELVSGPATIAGNELTIIGAGTVCVKAVQAGNENFEAAESVSRTFAVNKAAQTISFAELSDKTFGDDAFELVASSSSELAVSFELVSGPATIAGNELTITGAGTVVLKAVQVGNGNYEAAESVSRTFAVNKATQAISFAELSDKAYGDAAFKLVANSSSDLAVSFELVSGPATIVGNELTITGAGVVTVKAVQTGNKNFKAAESVNKTFTVNKAAQAISFAELDNKTFVDAAFELVASSSSELAVSFELVSGPATIVGNELTITGAGTVVLKAVQTGNENFEAAESVNRTFTVNKAAQTITFAELADKTFGDAAFELVASSSSDLAVSFELVSGPATIAENQLTITGAGTVVLKAVQTGNENFEAAESVSRTFTVNKAAQVITFAELDNNTFGDAAFDLVTNSSSDLAVSFELVSGPATIVGNELTITGAGVVTVKAVQTGNENFEAAESVSRTFTVNKAAQVITFAELSDKTFSDAAFDLVANSSSDLAVSFELVSGPATIVGNELTITGPGNVTVKAVQSGNENFEAAESVIKTFTVNKAAQTISFAELDNKTFGDAAFELVANSSSDLAVSFELVSGPATIADNKLTITEAGDVTVKAVQSGNENFEAAESVNRTFTVNKAAQAITFAELSDKTFGDAAFELVANSSSELAVSFELVSGPATIADNELTITGAGTVVLKAVQSGNENFEAAESVNRTFTVNKAAQAISFAELDNKTFGDNAFELVTNSSSDLAVSFELVSGPATIAGNELTITGAGTVVLKAVQTGNVNFEAAESVSRTFAVNKATQAISFAELSDKAYGDAAFKLVANSSSDLAVSFELVSGPATIVGNELTITGAGVVTVKAVQTGNKNFKAAESVNKTFTVNKAAQAISFAELDNKTFGDAAFELVASSSSELAVSFELVSGPATIVGNELTITGAGTVVLKAVQTGNENFEAAESVNRTFTVNKAAQTITFAELADKTFGDAAFELVASSSSDLAVSFELVSGPATIAENQLTITGAGTVVLKAVQTENENFEAAESVSRTFTVNKAAQAISFAELDNKTFGDAAFELLANSSSDLDVSFELVSGPATIAENTLTTTGTGDVTVEAVQSGNDNYEAAESLSRTFTVNKAAQAISFAELDNKTFGDAAFDLVANSSSELAVSFELVSGPATIADNELTITGAGTVVLKAVQLGNENFEAAESVSRTFTVNKAAQAITFAELDNKTFGDAAFDLSASSSSDLAVSFELVSGPATIAENKLTITGAGDVTIKAVQAGNENFEAAESVSRTFTVNKAAQAITFVDAPNSAKVNDVITLIANASSTLSVSFTIVSGTADLNGDQLTCTSEGTIQVKARQEGSDEFEAAEAIIEISISKKEQTIAFVDVPANAVINDGIELNAIASSELEVTFELVSGVADITENYITFNEVGTVEIKAIQKGNDEYEACEETISIQVDFATGIEEVSKSSTQIYPNPVETEMVIKFSSSMERTIRIFDLQGRLKLQTETSSTSKRLNLSSFKSGMYLMRVQAKNESFTYKIIKK